MGGKIYGQTIGRNTFYYYHEYHREKINKGDKGKTRNTGKSRVVTNAVYLGRAEDILKVVKEAKKEGRAKSVKEVEFGLPLALYNIAEKIGLVDIIDKQVNKREQGLSVGEYVLISAINRVGNSTSKERMSSWLSLTALKYLMKGEALKLRSWNFYDNFEKIISEKEVREKKREIKKEGNSKLSVEELEKVIDDEAIIGIEEGIWYKLKKEFNLQLDLILYDTTPFIMHIDKFTECSIPQAGHNSKGIKNKRQIKLAVGCLKECDLPIMHKVYCGNIGDVTLFGSAIRELVSRYEKLKKGTGELILIFDKGNISEDNVVKYLEGEVNFVSSLIPSNHIDLLKIKLEKYEHKYKDYKVYEVEKEVFGKERKIVITYNEKLRERQKKTFEDKIKKIREEIKLIYKKNKGRQDVKEIIENKLGKEHIFHSKARRYIEYEIKEGKISVRKEKRECEKKELSFGKNILFTSMRELNYDKVIEYYKGKYKIEDVFKLLNQGIKFTPVRHWTDSKIRVHGFVCVIALLLIKLLEYLAKQNGINLRSEQIIDELRAIKEAILIYPDKVVDRKVMELTSPLQRKLFSIYQLDKFI